jgi:hypothetical protein
MPFAQVSPTGKTEVSKEEGKKKDPDGAKNG